jgi:aspartate aminotransferase
VNGFSKTYAMTGWRLGYLAGKNGLVQAAAVVQRTMHGAVSSPTQRAGLAALAGVRQPWQREMHAAYDRRRRLGHQRLAAIPRFQCALPEATFYFWVKVDTSMSSADMAKFFHENGVAVRSGSEFGTAGEGYIRLTFAASDEDILEGIERLGQAADRLPPPVPLET